MEFGGPVGHLIGDDLELGREEFQELLQVGGQQLRRGVRAGSGQAVIGIEGGGQVDHGAGGVHVDNAGHVVQKGHSVERFLLALDIVGLLGQDPGNERVERGLVTERLLDLVFVYGRAVLPYAGPGEIDLEGNRLVLDPHARRGIGGRSAAGRAVRAVVIAVIQVGVQVGVPIAGGQRVTAVKADLAKPVGIRAGVDRVDDVQFPAVRTDGHKGTAQDEGKSVQRVLHAGGEYGLAAAHERAGIHGGETAGTGSLMDQLVHDGVRVLRGKGSCHVFSLLFVYMKLRTISLIVSSFDGISASMRCRIFACCCCRRRVSYFVL